MTRTLYCDKLQAITSSGLATGSGAWVPILSYHRILPNPPAYDPAGNCTSMLVFARQLRWLADHGYRSAPLAELNRIFEQPDAERSPRPRSVVITFDDGYQDNFLYAWPVLTHFGFTATVFLVSDAIGADNSFDAGSGYDSVPMLTTKQIRLMHRGGLDFGSHTCSHPASLAALPDAGLDRELVESRAAIERLLDAPVEHFAYPYNRHDARVEAAVERAGYRLACAGVGTRASRFALPRLAPADRCGFRLDAYLRWRRLKRAVRARLPERLHL
jgi:peptidoglycan/xylan/chitin deacetylase (PgdA/CDA1 family)